MTSAEIKMMVGLYGWRATSKTRDAHFANILHIHTRRLCQHSRFDTLKCIWHWCMFLKLEIKILRDVKEGSRLNCVGKSFSWGVAS